MSGHIQKMERPSAGSKALSKALNKALNKALKENAPNAAGFFHDIRDEICKDRGGPSTRYGAPAPEACGEIFRAKTEKA